jgi:hypothetical protein
MAPHTYRVWREPVMRRSSGMGEADAVCGVVNLQMTLAATDASFWLVLAISVGVGALVVIVRLLRDHDDNDVPTEVRQQQLFTAVTTWTTQGWTVESESNESALLANGADRMLVAVDDRGRVTARTHGVGGAQ